MNHEAGIPYLGLILTDMTFIMEGGGAEFMAPSGFRNMQCLALAGSVCLDVWHRQNALRARKSGISEVSKEILPFFSLLPVSEALLYDLSLSKQPIGQ